MKIEGSGSTPKCHGSATLPGTGNSVRYLEVEFSRAEAVGGAGPSVAQGPALPVHGQPGQEILLLDPANQINTNKKIPSDSLQVNVRQFK
jgi:hypothetical protein